MDSISNIAKNLGGVISENSPTILTSLAVAGLISTSVLAVKATPKALFLIDDHLYKQYGEDMYGEHGNTVSERLASIPKRELIRVTWKCYIPAGAVGLASICCIIYANQIHLRRTAALASLYGITEATLKEYQSKVIETIGKSKELKVRDEIAGDRVKANPPGSNQVIITNKGDVICYDSLTGRYFKSSVEQIRRALNKLNQRLMSEMFISLNELYYELGLANTKLGDDLGWDLDKGLIEISFSTTLTEQEEPCLVLNYEVSPKYLK